MEGEFRMSQTFIHQSNAPKKQNKGKTSLNTLSYKKFASRDSKLTANAKKKYLNQNFERLIAALGFIFSNIYPDLSPIQTLQNFIYIFIYQ